jgi:AcrR family transcriptional regulator
MKSVKPEAGAQADAFRERIVEASLALIEEQGLGALSMREVARRAGVSHQAPYHHFADREAILGAIAEQGFRLLREQVSAAIGERAASLSEALLHAGEAYITFAFANPAHFRMMFRRELVDTEHHEGCRSESDRACAIFYDAVRRAVEAGLPADEGVDALFLLCWSVGHGLACLVLDGPLDVVMPGRDRSEQMHEVLRTFGHLLDARMAQAARVSTKPRQKSSPAGRR